MTKEDFLTIRWNNILTLGLGLVMLIYFAFAVSTVILSELAAFISIVVIGVVY